MYPEISEDFILNYLKVNFPVEPQWDRKHEDLLVSILTKKSKITDSDISKITQRFHQFSPELIKEKILNLYWKPDEDQAILDFVIRNGTDWYDVQDEMPSRTIEQIQKRSQFLDASDTESDEIIVPKQHSISFSKIKLIISQN